MPKRPALVLELALFIANCFAVVIAHAAPRAGSLSGAGAGAAAGAAVRHETPAKDFSIPDAARLRWLSARLVPTDLRVDVRGLSLADRRALSRIVEAARVMDGIYLRQVWAGSSNLLLELALDATALGRARLHAFVQNKGPWLRLDADAPFLPGIGAKPAGGTFYPADSNKAEIEAWMKNLKPGERESAAGFFTTIRRASNGALQIVPYSSEYQPELSHASALLREAARFTTDARLRAYLDGRAQAFATNDYRESDKQWMDLDGTIEPTIGPYEVYEDGWFNAKAAFEAFVAIRDDQATLSLAHLGGHLQDIEDHLPIDPKLRNPRLGAVSPIRVVNSIFSAGDANRGVQTAAFNLPNDERTTQVLGAKRTLIKNVQEAKFKQVLLPISRIVLGPAEASTRRNLVSFDAFFTHILMHELMHGLGPHKVFANPEVSVRTALQESGSAIEEAKADISGLFALQFLVDKGVLDRRLEDSIYTTFLASAFRSLRFGITEAHAKGIALQLNALLDAGAVTVRADGRFDCELGKMKAAVVALTAQLMTLQASGDRSSAASLLRERAVIRPPVARALARLAHIPVDIEPRFVTADELRSGQ